ncbi:hypothetical protein, partial [Photobacterium sanguinicancri]|uniref:hypothetical protein n=1 Tax=Photobacterium sanguinicancri TaxID=875932 RepID=UPI0019619D85
PKKKNDSDVIGFFEFSDWWYRWVCIHTHIPDTVEISNLSVTLTLSRAELAGNSNGVHDSVILLVSM